jgi:ATP-dependent DNA ligase
MPQKMWEDPWDGPVSEVKPASERVVWPLKKLLKISSSRTSSAAQRRTAPVAQEFGLEGLVAKKKNSVYESGQRSGAWVKFKITKSQEFVIGGYTLPEGGRKYFGFLLVGYHSPEGLMYASTYPRRA